MKNPVRIIVLLVQCVGFVASVHAQPRSITNQLVVHLTFDNTLNDNSGRGNNATYNSANKNWFASANPGWGIFAQNGGNFRVQMTDSVTTSLRIAGTRPNVVRDGSWHHIVVTLKVGGTRNIY